MNEFVSKMKDLMSSSAKFVGRTVNVAAIETKFKANEMSINNKRRELISDLGKKVLELNANGFELPQAAVEIVYQINTLDAELDALRNEHAAKKATVAEQQAMEKADRAAKKTAGKTKNAEFTFTNDFTEEDTSDEDEVPSMHDVEVKENTEDDNRTQTPTLNV